MLTHATYPCLSFTARQDAEPLDNQRQASTLTLSRALLASNPIERRRGPCLRERTHGPSLSQQLSFVLKTHVPLPRSRFHPYFKHLSATEIPESPVILEFTNILLSAHVDPIFSEFR
jgi:hypothetical protein